MRDEGSGSDVRVREFEMAVDSGKGRSEGRKREDPTNTNPSQAKP
jgi:hypothetical protein